MTNKQIFIVAQVMVAALFTPTLLMKSGLLNGGAETAQVQASDSAQTSNDDVQVSKASYEEDDDADGYSVTTERDSTGHFNFDTTMNGTDVPVMVDTGASVVAINLSTAEAIGVNVDTESRGVSVNTANGRARAWPATIDEIAIGEVVVENVRAMVMEDEALSDTLLGMSFLNKLSGFDIADGEMTLTQ